MESGFHFPKLKSTSKTDSKKQYRQRTFSNDENLTLKSSIVTKQKSSHLFESSVETKIKYNPKSPAYFKRRGPSLNTINEKHKNHEQSIEQYINWHKKVFDKQSLLKIAQKKFKYDINYKMTICKSKQLLNAYGVFETLDRPFKQSNYDKFPKPKVAIIKNINPVTKNLREKPLLKAEK